jgi:hypothetical protein
MTNENFDVQNVDNQILLNPDVKQRILMMTGESKDKKLELTKDQEKQIARHFATMFYALTTIHWCNGATLGVAWQKALEQMSSFVKTKSNPEHPMNKYLHALDNQYRRDISERIMTSPYSDSKIEMNSERAKQWVTHETQEYKKSLQFMNDMYKQYMPEKKSDVQPKVVSFKIAQEKTYEQMLKILQINQMTNERAA